MKDDIKQLLDKVFLDIQNYQGRGKRYQPKPKAEADNTYQDLDNSGYHKRTNSIIVYYTLISQKEMLLILKDAIPQYSANSVFLRVL